MGCSRCCFISGCRHITGGLARATAAGDEQGAGWGVCGGAVSHAAAMEGAITAGHAQGRGGGVGESCLPSWWMLLLLVAVGCW